MKKYAASICLLLLLATLLTGCGKQITLHLSYGERTGTYSGAMEGGVPHGWGKFVSQNSSSGKWTYEGMFNKGHFEGSGRIDWANGRYESGIYRYDVLVPISKERTQLLYTAPEQLKGSCVEVVGKLYGVPEYKTGSVSFQMWTDTKNWKNNVLVRVYDSNFQVKQGDFVQIVGTVWDVYTGDSEAGEKLSVPTIAARKYSIITEAEATAFGEQP